MSGSKVTTSIAWQDPSSWLVEPGTIVSTTVWPSSWILNARLMQIFTPKHRAWYLPALVNCYGGVLVICKPAWPTTTWMLTHIDWGSPADTWSKATFSLSSGKPAASRAKLNPMDSVCHGKMLPMLALWHVGPTPKKIQRLVPSQWDINIIRRSLQTIWVIKTEQGSRFQPLHFKTWPLDFTRQRVRMEFLGPPRLQSWLRRSTSANECQDLLMTIEQKKRNMICGASIVVKLFCVIFCILPTYQRAWHLLPAWTIYLGTGAFWSPLLLHVMLTPCCLSFAWKFQQE